MTEEMHKTNQERHNSKLFMSSLGGRCLSTAGAGGNCVLALLSVARPHPSKIVHPWVQKFYPALRLESGEGFLWHEGIAPF